MLPCKRPIFPGFWLEQWGALSESPEAEFSVSGRLGLRASRARRAFLCFARSRKEPASFLQLEISRGKLFLPPWPINAASTKERVCRTWETQKRFRGEKSRTTSDFSKGKLHEKLWRPTEPCAEQGQFSHSIITPDKMQNDAGDNVDLYIPRKWYVICAPRSRCVLR